MDIWIIILVIAIPVKILFWVFVCCRMNNRREQTVVVHRSIRSENIEGQPGQLFQTPSGQIVRVNSVNMQPPPYNPEQAGMPGRPVDHDPRVGISPKIGLVDQA